MNQFIKQLWRAAILLSVSLILLSCVKKKAAHVILPPQVLASIDRQNIPVDNHVTQNIPILMYHYVGAVPQNQKNNLVRQDLTVPLSYFEEQLSWLSNEHFVTTTLDSVARLTAYKSGKKYAVLSFDDGYDDAYTNVFPLLKKHKFIGSFAIITDFVGRDGYMTWAQIREMSDAGMEIVSHSVSHKEMTLLSPKTLQYEIRQSKKILEKMLGKTINVFIYPSGFFNASVEDELLKSGYVAARTTKSGVAQSVDNPYELPAVRIHGAVDMGKFSQLIDRMMKKTIDSPVF